MAMRPNSIKPSAVDGSNLKPAKSFPSGCNRFDSAALGAAATLLARDQRLQEEGDGVRDNAKTKRLTRAHNVMFPEPNEERG